MINIGIDKTVIKGFFIKLMDKVKLLANDNVIFQERDKGIATVDTEENEVSINYLKITDGCMFNTLSMGVKFNKGVPNYYSMIEISISELTDSNLKPLTISEYWNMLERIKKYLENRYGLYMDFDNCYFGDIEINVTAVMDRQFIEYEYLLNNMAYLVPKSYKVAPFMDNNRNYNQYEFFNGSVSAKIYDKTKQLREKFKISLDKQYMRIEYTLHSPTKVETSLGSKYVKDITDKAIIDYLHKMINRDLIAPIEKHIKDSNKKLLKMAKEVKAQDNNKWVRNFLYMAIAERVNKTTGALPLVIDIKQITDTIKTLTPKLNRSRALNRIQEDINNLPYLINNLDKLTEIKDKFL